MADARHYAGSVEDEAARRLFEETPKVSYFSVANGPNAGGVVAAKGTFGINISPSGNTVFWGQTSDGSSGWKQLEPN